MVFCSPAAVGAAVGGGATALGLKMDKQSVDLSRETFLQQMRQSKRLFTAQWAETSYRHGEALSQAAQQHAEAQALAMAQYHQAERIHSEGTKLARDQDGRAFEMTWRTEARESLRDELTNQFNRYNIIMLCDTVCLGCIMPLVESGAPPEETSQVILIMYLLSMGSSIMCFVVSLWFCVIVVRRLHEHTASILERKLFANSEQLQKVWQEQIENGLPSDYQVMNLLNQAYQDWLQYNIHTMGSASIQAMSVGVIFLFVTAGLLTHARYLIDYNAPTAVGIFWSTVIMGSLTVIFFKLREDRKERMKQGSYDKSWMDIPTTIGPMAKIATSTDQLFSSVAVRLGSKRRRDEYKDRERSERAFVANTEALHAKAESLLSEKERRAKARKDVLEALTAAAEELDVLPEDLITHLNDVIHQVDELDKKTAEAVAMPSRYSDNISFTDIDDEGENQKEERKPMNANPIDAHRTTVFLPSLRARLGEIALTTLIRIRNLSEEPLRIRSGVQLKSGKYIKDVDVALLASYPNRSLEKEAPRSKVTYHLFPIEEIPPRTEVVMAARSAGVSWLPTSGIEGELMFVNSSQTWAFQIRFANSFNDFGVRQCHVDAAPFVGTVDPGKVSNERWSISREIIDNLNNQEVFIAIDQKQRVDSDGQNNIANFPKLLELDSNSTPKQSNLKSSHTTRSEEAGLLSTPKSEPVMSGNLSLMVVGLQAFWLRRWCHLTSTSMAFFVRPNETPELEILLQHVTKVRAIPNAVNVHKQRLHVFDVYSSQRKPIRLAASTIAKRDEWIQKLSEAKGRDIIDWESHVPTSQVPSEEKKSDKLTIEADTSTGTREPFMIERLPV